MADYRRMYLYLTDQIAASLRMLEDNVKSLDTICKSISDTHDKTIESNTSIAKENVKIVEENTSIAKENTKIVEENNKTHDKTLAALKSHSDDLINIFGKLEIIIEKLKYGQFKAEEIFVETDEENDEKDEEEPLINQIRN